jgi:hypothetical protein
MSGETKKHWYDICGIILMYGATVDLRGDSITHDPNIKT